MSNKPKTYHLLVTLDDVTGEESDQIAELLQDFLDDLGHENEVEHLASPPVQVQR